MSFESDITCTENKAVASGLSTMHLEKGPSPCLVLRSKYSVKDNHQNTNGELVTSGQVSELQF